MASGLIDTQLSMQYWKSGMENSVEETIKIVNRGWVLNANWNFEAAKVKP